MYLRLSSREKTLRDGRRKEGGIFKTPNDKPCTMRFWREYMR
ncbi:hypothetical protein CaCOL14_008459 [Colletotrichum acutatum]